MRPDPGRGAAADARSTGLDRRYRVVRRGAETLKSASAPTNFAPDFGSRRISRRLGNVRIGSTTPFPGAKARTFLQSAGSAGRVRRPAARLERHGTSIAADWSIRRGGP